MSYVGVIDVVHVAFVLSQRYSSGYRNYPMFSDAKNNYFGEKLGVSENKGCPKNMFLNATK